MESPSGTAKPSAGPATHPGAGSASVFRDDLELVRRTMEGDPKSVEEFLERMQCVRRMLSYRNRRYGSPLGPEEIEDLVQETLVAVWRKLEDFRGAAPLEAWVYRFTFLQTVARMRELQRRPRPVADLPEEAVEDPLPREVEEFSALYGALERVGPPGSDIIAMKLLEGLRFRDIAERLGMPTNTVKTRYYRGLRRMRDLLEHPQEGGSDA